ncbi:hypothetical protein LIER_20252 [Lithospermum erythrorhizon]|uniref:Reverse transcriptase domain-containing protein n=1 Tax=Lithospermum erythrorhizon TaxID=34254 RepID=A0AAV3QNJ3_LITER
MQELVCGYHKRTDRPRCALKIDVMKAYDTVNWSFLWSVLKSLNYPSKFVEWIKACVTSAWVSVSVNGSLEGATIDKSMHLIRKTLKEFGNLSGLYPNLSKSTSFFADVEDEEAWRLK